MAVALLPILTFVLGLAAGALLIIEISSSSGLGGVIATLFGKVSWSFDVGTVIAALGAAGLAYVFGYRDYLRRRERDRLTRRYIDEGLDVHEADLTTDLNQTMNTLYAAQDWLGGDVHQTEELYLANLAPETRAIGTVALTRTKDLFQHGELTDALLQLQMNMRIANEFARRELPHRLKKGERKADLNALSDKTFHLIARSDDVPSQIGEMTSLFENWLSKSNSLQLSQFRSDPEAQQRLSQIVAKVTANVASRKELRRALFPAENTPDG